MSPAMTYPRYPSDGSSDTVQIEKATRKLHSAEEKIRIVLKGLRGSASSFEPRLVIPAHDFRSGQAVDALPRRPRGAEATIAPSSGARAAR